MRKIFTYLLLLSSSSLLLWACAVEETSPKSAHNKEVFDAWIKSKYPSINKSGRGIYVLEHTEGGGETISDKDTILFVEYTERDLNGNILSTSSENIAKQIGSYQKSNYYGPVVWIQTSQQLGAGLLDALKGMKIGGNIRVCIPGWLNVMKDYKTEEEFIKHEAGEARIFDIKLHEKAHNIKEWEESKIQSHVTTNMAGAKKLKEGFYYKQLVAGSNNKKLQKDTTVYINYIGKILNGQVFDCTYEDLAKIHGIYTKSKKYKPINVNIRENYKDITMGNDNAKLIDGFAYCLSNMTANEKAICIFNSSMGYGRRANAAIPSFSPLIFEIELVTKPDSSNE